MGLELPGDERVGRADEMQHLDDLAVARHRAAGGESDRRRHRHDHEGEEAMARTTTASAMVPMRAAQMR